MAAIMPANGGRRPKAIKHAAAADPRLAPSGHTKFGGPRVSLTINVVECRLAMADGNRIRRSIRESRMNGRCGVLWFALTTFLLFALPSGWSAIAAQTTDQDLAAIASRVAVDAPTGYERRFAPALGAGWTADRYGNVVTTIGTGTPNRLVACALDRPGYVVSQIRDDGS